MRHQCRRSGAPGRAAGSARPNAPWRRPVAPRSAACCRQLQRRRRARPCRAGRRPPRCARLDCRPTAAPLRHRLLAQRQDCRRGGKRIPRPSAARRARRAGRRACATARAPRRCARHRSAPATAAAATRSRRGSGGHLRAPAAPPRRSGRDRGRREWRRAAHSRAGRVCWPSRRRRRPRRPCRPAAGASRGPWRPGRRRCPTPAWRATRPGPRPSGRPAPSAPPLLVAGSPSARTRPTTLRQAPALPGARRMSRGERTPSSDDAGPRTCRQVAGTQVTRARRYAFGSYLRPSFSVTW